MTVVIPGALPDEAAEDQTKLHLDADTHIFASRTLEAPACRAFYEISFTRKVSQS